MLGSSLLLAGCAGGAAYPGSVAELAPPPDVIAPFTGAAHMAAFQAAITPEMAKASSRDQTTFLRGLSDRGNPIAQYLLAMGYDTGDGVDKDYATAARLYHAAAMAGYAPAQSYIGDKYETGIGVPRDQAIANRWYRLAAEQGEDSATGRLAFAMITGKGMATDVPTAMKLLQNCADPQGGPGVYHPSGDKGGPSCQMVLGGIYEEGIGGIAIDLKAAAYWYQRAADQHMPVAEKRLAILCEEGAGVEQDSAKAKIWRDGAAADAGRQLGSWTQL